MPYHADCGSQPVHEPSGGSQSATQRELSSESPPDSRLYSVRFEAGKTCLEEMRPPETSSSTPGHGPGHGDTLLAGPLETPLHAANGGPPIPIPDKSKEILRMGQKNKKNAPHQKEALWGGRLSADEVSVEVHLGDRPLAEDRLGVDKAPHGVVRGRALEEHAARRSNEPPRVAKGQP